MDIPAQYEWLHDIGPLPRITQEALKLYGTHEAPGDADNPTILAWAKEVGVADVYKHDAIAWCGLTMAVIAKRAGKPVVHGPLWAANWGHFGVESPAPSLGDVMVFVRSGGGHVSTYIAEDGAAYHVLGGNQSDEVNITRILKVRLSHARRPIWRAGEPASVRPYHVAASGVLSTNEG